MNSYQFNYINIYGKPMVKLVLANTLEEAIKEVKKDALPFPDVIELVYEKKNTNSK